jgi:hypothetical protein
MGAQESPQAIGQAVFLKTDTPDYAEQIVAFRNLDEMVELCSRSRPNLVLDKVIIYSMVDAEPCALTLGFVSATKGQRPAYHPVG